MAVFNINNDDVIALTAKLERLHRSALPVAIRSSLNDTAFNSKNNIPKLAARKFTIRQKNLYKKFITVEKATGFDVGTMAAAVGVVKGSGKTSKITAGLAAQELGRPISGRKLIPIDEARISGSKAKKLKTKHQFTRIKITTPKKRVPGSKYILIKKGSTGTVFDVSKRNKITPVYAYRPNNKTTLRARPVIRPAAAAAYKNINKSFEIAAQKQFKRLLK